MPVNSLINFVPVLELLYEVAFEIRVLVSFSVIDLEIERLYLRDWFDPISSWPSPQLNITRLLIANDSSTVGGVGLILLFSNVFKKTDSKELSSSPISNEPDATISGFRSWSISTKDIVLAPLIVCSSEKLRLPEPSFKNILPSSAQTLSLGSVSYTHLRAHET